MKNRNRDRNLSQQSRQNDSAGQQQQGEHLRQPGGDNHDDGSRQQGGWSDN